MEQEDLDFHKRVRDGYLLQAKEEPASWLVLNGLKTPDELLNDVLAHFRGKKWLV
jgi:thymidylate kinase